IHLTISLQKLQQKALQQPKQKKSKSAEFLMGSEDGATVVGIENPAFDGGGSSAEPCAPPAHLGRGMRGDRPDSTLAARPKKLELQAPAKERGEASFFISFKFQTDPRQCMTTGVNTEDELELTMPNADEKRLYHRMAALLDDENSFVDIPGTVLSSRDEEVLEVKAGDPVLQRRLLLHAGADASGSRPSQVHSAAKTAAKAADGLRDKTGLQAGRMVMGKESSVKVRTAEDVIPHYAQQLRERVRPDMITLGSLSLQQKGPQKESDWEKRKRRLVDFFTGKNQSTIQNNSAVVLQDSPAPQPVEVCVRCLRATRDKVPKGLYSVRVGLYSRLGGPILGGPGPEQQQQQHEGYVSTEPVHHRGQCYDIDLQVNQSLTMVLPAPTQVVPSMVLVFELVALPGHGSHVSSVLGWGAFPVCGPSFSLIQGKFKTPLLRGEPFGHLDQFKKIESLISSDLDHWLCNLYFQVSLNTLSFIPQKKLVFVVFVFVVSILLIPDLLLAPIYRAGETAVAPSHQGSPLLLSADSACSSSSSPGRGFNKKPIKKTNSTRPSTSGSSAAPRQYKSHQPKNIIPRWTPSVSSRLSDRTRLALRMLPSELGWPSPWQQARSWRGFVRQPGLIMLLLALMWFVRLYLHYCSQWLYLQAIAVPVNKFRFHAHTVELVYQGSLLHTREELAMVVVGPLTLNAVTLLLVLIRWAFFAVDAVLGHLVYSPETPVGDAAKLFWHFYRVDRSGVAGIILTVFLYSVLTILSLTIMFIYLLRFHNDGRMLDVYQRLTATEGTYFLPQDLEVSNQELSYIVKKAEQWRGYNGERRKVAVYDHIWTEEDPLVVSTVPHDNPPSEGVPAPSGETSTNVTVYTLFLSGLRQKYRQFLRQPDGAITEVDENEDGSATKKHQKCK
uniref:Uncharacterized protein n=1 Tax=Neogobius melanostomus TaxID=47308 RepID=A0A8C6WMW9_9GOBI